MTKLLTCVALGMFFAFATTFLMVGFNLLFGWTADTFGIGWAIMFFITLLGGAAGGAIYWVNEHD